MRRFGTPPSADEMEAIARRAMEALPEPFAGHLRDVVLLVQEFADDATLHAMGIEEPFDLTGIYEGIPITERSVEHSGTLPDRIRLFRRPILDADSLVLRDGVIVGIRRQHHDAGLRELRPDLATRLDARAVREADIHDDDVGPEPTSSLDRLRDRARLGRRRRRQQLSAVLVVGPAVARVRDRRAALRGARVIATAGPSSATRTAQAGAPGMLVASRSAAAWTGEGQRRTSHSPHAAKAKLEMLPNKVALPSFVMWMPVCQAARSAAKKKAANAIKMPSAFPGQCTGWPE